MSNKKGEIVSFLAIGAMLFTMAISFATNFFMQDNKSSKIKAQIRTPKCMIDNPQNQSCRAEGSWCIVCTGNRGPCNTDAGVGLPFQCQSGKWNLTNNLGECNVTCAIQEFGQNQTNHSSRDDRSNQTNINSNPNTALSGSLTSVDNGCFSIRAEFEVRERDSGKKSFYSWVTFQSDKGGDVKLDYNGIHVAGWNLFKGGSFTYSPQWTQPHTHEHEAGIASLMKGQEMSFNYRGMHSGCIPQDVFLNCSIGYRNDGSTFVSGQGCSCRNCQPTSQPTTSSLSRMKVTIRNLRPQRRTLGDGCTGGNQCVTPTPTPQPGTLGGTCKYLAYNYASFTTYSGDCEDGLVCHPQKGICVTPTPTPQPGTLGGSCKNLAYNYASFTTYSGDCEDGLVCDPYEGICVTPKPTFTPTRTPTIGLNTDLCQGPFPCGNNPKIKYYLKCTSVSANRCVNYLYYKNKNCGDYIGNNQTSLDDYCKNTLTIYYTIYASGTISLAPNNQCSSNLFFETKVSYPYIKVQIMRDEKIIVEKDLYTDNPPTKFPIRRSITINTQPGGSFKMSVQYLTRIDSFPSIPCAPFYTSGKTSPPVNRTNESRIDLYADLNNQ